ncbi:MAG: hypothetical protein NTW71_03085 [Deltaproteobacteria bacterium]|nr:hypothetical protein [Deltaproteobacteria bacterium]
MSDPLILTRTIMILCAVVAAICTTAGSWVKIKRGDPKRRLSAGLTYGGYFFLFASIALFIILGLAR